MDRGLFPIYYLHLERDTGKKIFLLAGENLELSAFLIVFLKECFFLREIRSKAEEEQDIELRNKRRPDRPKPANRRLRGKA